MFTVSKIKFKYKIKFKIKFCDFHIAGVTKPVAYNIPKAYQSMDVTFQLTFSFPTTTTNNVCFGINFSSPLVLSVPIGCITVPNIKNILPPTSG
jgi:hypothetical protein